MFSGPPVIWLRHVDATHDYLRPPQQACLSRSVCMFVCASICAKNRKYSSCEELDYNGEVFPTALISRIVRAIVVIGSPSE